MDIPYKIRAILLLNPLITALIADKIFPIFVSQGDNPPAILYEFEEREPMQSVSCKVRVSTIALHCFSLKYDEAKYIADLIEQSLDKFHDNEIHFCLMESKKDIPESVEEGSGQIYHVEIIFNIQSI